MFYKKGVIENFANGLEACNFIKKENMARCFAVNFLMTPFLQNTTCGSFCSFPFYQQYLSRDTTFSTLVLNPISYQYLKKILFKLDASSLMDIFLFGFLKHPNGQTLVHNQQ